MKDDNWFVNINWDKACLGCQKVRKSGCPSRKCAEMCYDDKGNILPEYEVESDKNET